MLRSLCPVSMPTRSERRPERSKQRMLQWPSHNTSSERKQACCMPELACQWLGKSLQDFPYPRSLQDGGSHAVFTVCSASGGLCVCTGARARVRVLERLRPARRGADPGDDGHEHCRRVRQLRCGQRFRLPQPVDGAASIQLSLTPYTARPAGAKESRPRSLDGFMTRPAQARETASVSGRLAAWHRRGTT